MAQEKTFGGGEWPDLREVVPGRAMDLAVKEGQKGIPSLAHDRDLVRIIEGRVRELPTQHRMLLGDSRCLDQVADGSVHLAVTSPPYWTLKEYPAGPRQLGSVSDYDQFLDQLDQVWREVYRTLVPGGRLVVVVGDVCLSRRRNGRHVVVPLHASIQERCRRIGFDNLAPIIWFKIANATFEVENGSSFLGKPYEPNAVIKNDTEFILFQRKPGGYRTPSLAARILSVIPADRHGEWFTQAWNLRGASTRNHPAPYPLELAERLIRMFSFVGDTVLGPFLGSGTTSIAAARWGRHSVGYDVEPSYIALPAARFQKTCSVQLRLEDVSLGS